MLDFSSSFFLFFIWRISFRNVCVCSSSDNTDRVWPAGLLCSAALSGLWLAEDQAGGQPADPPHPSRLHELCCNQLCHLPIRNLSRSLLHSGLVPALPSSSHLQPLPEKFVMKGVVDRFSEEFVETRMKALDKFLKRVADHPVLSFNPHLNAFLSAKVRWGSPMKKSRSTNIWI